MSKKTQSKNAAVPLDGLATFAPIKSLAEVTAEFVSKHEGRKKSSGNNDYLRDFLQVANFLTENLKTFSFNDFLSLTRTLDTPASALAPLFHAWIAELEKSKRLTIVSGCYDWQQFTFK
jgi:hypothetical protein